MAEAKAAEKLEPPKRSDIETTEKEDDHSLPLKEVPDPEEDEDEESCAFCKFMKGGGCKDVFVRWMECVDGEKEKGNDFVETCMTQIQDLRECMLANPDYYRPMLEEEDHYLDEKEPQQERTKQTTESLSPKQSSNRNTDEHVS